jgi:diadenosine tetraphosphate (Ap4A) HIT family hydrolase
MTPNRSFADGDRSGYMPVHFELATLGGFRIEHCFDCAVPGYLIVSPVQTAASLSDLPAGAVAQLGPVLLAVNRAIQIVVAPLRIYCCLFAEQRVEVHFHVFPRTVEVTEEFLRVYPEQRDAICGPVLLDWARSHYRSSAPEAWRKVSPVLARLRAALSA